MTSNLGGYAIGDIVRTKTGKLDAVITELHPRSTAEQRAAHAENPWRNGLQENDAVTYRVVKDGAAWGPTRRADIKNLRIVRKAPLAEKPAPAPQPVPVAAPIAPAVRGTQLSLDLTTTQETPVFDNLTFNFDAPTQNPTPAENPTVAFVRALNARYGADGHQFGFTTGKKYNRVYKVEGRGSDSRSVHAFVDADGNVYKAAGWSAPAKGVRAVVRTPEQLNKLMDSLTSQDWAGGYLYR